MIYLTRREVFSASHRLYNPSLTEEENNDLYGKCSNKYGHGHNYILEVVVSGEIDKKTGFLIDLKKLKNIIIDNVIVKADHRHLNFDVDFMEGVLPTTENLAVAIWNQLHDKMEPANLYSVKVFETENNYVEYKG